MGKSINSEGRVSIKKYLSKNDTGETSSHQDGIAIPKTQPEIIEFFPPLDNAIKNPACLLKFDGPDGVDREFRYVYYNGKFFLKENGKYGTRNEYRLTRTTRFIRENGLSSGDSIIFHRTPADLPDLSQQEIDELPYSRRYQLSIEIERLEIAQDRQGDEGPSQPKKTNVLELSGKWVQISF